LRVIKYERFGGGLSVGGEACGPGAMGPLKSGRASATLSHGFCSSGPHGDAGSDGDARVVRIAVVLLARLTRQNGRCMIRSLLIL